MICNYFLHYFWNTYIAFLLKGICQIAISIWEVRLKLNSATIGVNSQVNEALLIVDTGQIPMNNCMIWTKAQCSEISSHSSRKAK